jgi:hypothetical protein
MNFYFFNQAKSNKQCDGNHQGCSCERIHNMLHCHFKPSLMCPDFFLCTDCFSHSFKKMRSHLEKDSSKHNWIVLQNHVSFDVKAESLEAIPSDLKATIEQNQLLAMIAEEKYRGLKSVKC